MTFVGSDLGFGVQTQSRALAIIRIGAVLTFLGTALADRRGRRPLILWSIVIAALFAAIGGLGEDVAWVTGSQVVCRGLVAVGVLLLPVLAAEEVPAGSRAFVTGLIAMSGGLGVGMVLWVLPFADCEHRRVEMDLGTRAPGRARHLSGSAATCRRAIRSSRELTAGHREHAVTPSWRGRLLRFGARILMLDLFITPVFQLQNDFLNIARGFSARPKLAVFLSARTPGEGSA